MLHIPGFFSLFVTTHPAVAYGAFFLGAFWEGELTLIMAGILVHLGIFSFPMVLIVTLCAAVTKTVLGYRLGAWIGKRFPNSPVLKYLERRVLFFLPRFRENPFWSIVISKCIYGVNNVTLVFAGYVRARWRTYVLAEACSSAVWLSAMFALGFFFSRVALSISHSLRNFALVLLGFIVIFIFVQKAISLVIEFFEELDLERSQK